MKQIGIIGAKVCLDIPSDTTLLQLKTMIISAINRVAEKQLEFINEEFLQKIKDSPESDYTGEGIYIHLKE